MQLDPVLTEIYKTVLGGAPYVLAAYVALLVGFFAYVAFVFVRQNRVEKQIEVLESSLARRDAKQ